MLHERLSSARSVLAFAFVLAAFAPAAGCMAESDEGDDAQEETTNEVEQAIVAPPAKINPYFSDWCWSGSSPVGLVPCGSGTKYSIEDPDASGTFRFYLGTKCLTVVTDTQITLETCTDPLINPSKALAQRWRVSYQSGSGVDTVYQVQSKSNNRYLRASGISLVTSKSDNPADIYQLWQYAKYN